MVRYTAPLDMIALKLFIYFALSAPYISRPVERAKDEGQGIVKLDSLADKWPSLAHISISLHLQRMFVRTFRVGEELGEEEEFWDEFFHVGG